MYWDISFLLVRGPRLGLHACTTRTACPDRQPGAKIFREHRLVVAAGGPQCRIAPLRAEGGKTVRGPRPVPSSASQRAVAGSANAITSAVAMMKPAAVTANHHTTALPLRVHHERRDGPAARRSCTGTRAPRDPTVTGAGRRGMQPRRPPDGPRGPDEDAETVPAGGPHGSSAARRPTPYGS